MNSTPRPETTTPICTRCNDEGKILWMWDRPGGPPGNGWGGCPDCAAGLRYDAATRAETEAHLAKFTSNMDAAINSLSGEALRQWNEVMNGQR